jgi:hypothetical protein
MPSCVQLTTPFADVLALVRMYGCILTIYSIIWYCGTQDMHLEEMERSGVFPTERLDWRDFSSAALHFLMHLSM